MKVYGDPGSTCTRKVLTTLHEKGLPAELVEVTLAKRMQKSPEHLARQPFGVIPVFEDDDGTQLYESRAIIRYLDRRYPEPSLTPSDVHAYGVMEQWLSIEQSYFSTPALTVVKAVLWKRESELSKVGEAQQKLAHTLGVADHHLLSHPFMAGERFSLADISWMPYVEYLAMTSIGQNLLGEHAQVSGWWERVRQRPSWRAVSGKNAK